MTIQMMKQKARAVAGALMLLVLCATTAQAQALKVGFTDHEVLIANMQAFQDVQTQLQKETETGRQEMQTMYADYQEKLDRYQKQQALLSAEKRQEREQELMTLQQSIQQTAQQKEQDLGRRQAELMQPILDNVQKAIDKVAQARGLDIVLRSQVGVEPVLLYVNEQTVQNITMDVARELGIDVDAEPATSAAPAATPAATPTSNATPPNAN